MKNMKNISKNMKNQCIDGRGLGSYLFHIFFLVEVWVHIVFIVFHIFFVFFHIFSYFFRIFFIFFHISAEAFPFFQFLTLKIWSGRPLD